MQITQHQELKDLILALNEKVAVTSARSIFTELVYPMYQNATNVTNITFGAASSQQQQWVPFNHESQAQTMAPFNH